MSGGCLHNGYFNNGYFNTLNSKKNIIALTNQETTNRVLLPEESGSIITIDASTNTATNINITLPSIDQVGCEYTIIFLEHNQNINGNVTITTDNNSIDIMGYFKFTIHNGNSNAIFEALPLNVSKLTIGKNLVETSQAFIKLTSVSSNMWYLEGNFPTLNTPHTDNLNSIAGANTLVIFDDNKIIK